MKLKLTRTEFRDDGVFGELHDAYGNLIAVTLEHSYSDTAKIPVGTYTCMRGQHRLHDGVQFETFEVTEVPGHSDILFHCGNTNKDSEGCILLGLSRRSLDDGDMIVDSRAAFARFMTTQTGVDEFTMEVA